MTSILSAASQLPALGDPAPDFTLPSTSGDKVMLSGFRGRENVLLAFFPLAFTSTCTAELCAFRDDYGAFEGRGVRVLPISVDSVPTLQQYRASIQFEGEMLSDFHRDVSRLYGVLHPERFFSNRAYFLVDREGTLRWSHVEEVPSLRRENAELLAVIEQLG